MACGKALRKHPIDGYRKYMGKAIRQTSTNGQQGTEFTRNLNHQLAMRKVFEDISHYCTFERLENTNWQQYRITIKRVPKD